jgi:hypothetical protein
MSRAANRGWLACGWLLIVTGGLAVMCGLGSLAPGSVVSVPPPGMPGGSGSANPGGWDAGDWGGGTDVDQDGRDGGDWWSEGSDSGSWGSGDWDFGGSDSGSWGDDWGSDGGGWDSGGSDSGSW